MPADPSSAVTQTNLPQDVPLAAVDPAAKVTTLPSGAAFIFSSLTAKQANILADAAEDPTTTARLLSSCTRALVNPGPYRVDAGAPFNWSKALTGDRIAAILMIRAMTYGSSYEFKVKCSACGKRFGWGIQIPDDLTFRPYPQAALDAFISGQKGIEVTLPDGAKALAKILTGKDEEEAQRDAARLKREAKGQEMTFSLSRLFWTVDGVPSTPEAFEHVAFPDIPSYAQAASDIVGGVETDIDVKCTNVDCEEEQTISLPFGRDFFLPAKKSRVSSRT